MSAGTMLSEKVDIPGHVSPGLVYDFDYIADEALTTDPHARLAQVQAEAPPVFYTPRNGGHWMRAQVLWSDAREVVKGKVIQ